MKYFFSKIGKGLLNIYLWPLKRSFNLSVASRNHVVPFNIHLIGLIILLKKTGQPKQQGLLLDIGSYEGATSRLFARHLKKTSIISFEPNHEAFTVAKKKYQSVYPNIKFENIALSDR